MEYNSRQGGIYIHVPVCKGKCIYCSFYSVGCAERFNWRGFANAVVAELKNRVEEMSGWDESTLYIGGGTPSLMNPDVLCDMTSEVMAVSRARFQGDFKFTEVTLEVNPDDVDEERVLSWKKAGINRISLGVQSFQDDELRFIGRRHDSGQAIKAYKLLRNHFDNISLDLMFGLPGQTLESLRSNLNIIKTLHPEHISCYSLMFEERSALMKMREKGMVEETPEDISVEMFLMIDEELSAAGYRRYEISNYSKPGKESRHNSNYWIGIPYIGLGPSAHSYDGHAIRRWNAADLREYVKEKHLGNPEFSFEVLSADELREETIMTRLRIREGIDLKKFKLRFGEKEHDRLIHDSERFVNSGHMELGDKYLSLTKQGVMISDEIISSLF